ncbi:uncharacterized protein LOC106642400 [Copidosoma floridanum]|uniref:uncharacterized protein LOC106642400 n=1 Tax=Copidosoma floridanum TaxID=29053 RepID=UPI0006C93D36|nr:uncharacterized protein LOC106642400 [Copidosoma floridanum]
MDYSDHQTDQNKSTGTVGSHCLQGTFFLIGITGIFLISGFCSSLLTIRKNSRNFVHNNRSRNNSAEATGLALRALGRGSFYATMGCSLLFYGIWKFSGAETFIEFRYKMQKKLPKISKNNSSLQ